jgi:uncharacterized coiled-coil DUF342 family protein
MEQAVINWALAASAGVAGWFLRVLWEADKELRADLSKLREELPKTYAEKGSIDSNFLRVFSKLDELRDHIDKRMDMHEARYHNGHTQ